MRIILAGSPDFACGLLTVLKESGHELVAVLSQPDRPAGRGRKMTPPPLAIAAKKSGIPLLQPKTLKKKEIQDTLAGLRADVIVVAAYGLILPQEVLDIPRFGCVNVHASLLPRWRGASPIQQAIMAGDAETGITWMQMDAGLDTGPIIAVNPVDIADSDTYGTLSQKLAELAEKNLVGVLEEFAAKGLSTPQLDAGVTYAGLIKKSDAALDFSATAVELERKVRAMHPTPVAWCKFADAQGMTLRIHSARVYAGVERLAPRSVKCMAAGEVLVGCGLGTLELLRVQLPGKRESSARELTMPKVPLLKTGVRFD